MWLYSYIEESHKLSAGRYEQACNWDQNSKFWDFYLIFLDFFFKKKKFLD